MAEGDGSPKKIALVIGNSAYRYVRILGNPKNDAAAVAQTLQELAFDEIVSAIDLSQKDLFAKLQEFYAKLDRESTALLFYAGHGVQVWGQNYLLPCDARVDKASDLRSTAISLNDVVRAMSRRASTRLLFLDACRNDPLSNQAGGLERGARAVAIGSNFDDVGRGLAKVTATAGTFVAYATEPGNVALDGTGHNSPFTTALTKHIALPGMGVDDIMMQVRVDVLDATEGKQLPWSELALTRRFQFREGPAQSVSRDFEQEYWDRVKDTDNPDFLESFLRQFPNGRHAEAARTRIGGVRARKEASDWEAARSTDTIAALADFARRYPSSKNAAAARSRLFAKQLRRGSTILGAGVGGAIVGSVLVAGVLVLVLWVGRHYAPGDWITEIDKDPMQRLGPLVNSLLGVFVPSIVFGTVLWKGLTAYSAKPLKRVALALAAVFGPAIIIQFGPYVLDRWSISANDAVDAAELRRALESTIATAKKDPRYQNDPSFKQEAAQRVRSIKQAQRITYPARVYRPLAASALVGLAAGWTLLLTALAISGKKGLANWETPIVAGVLLAVASGLAIYLIAGDDPSVQIVEVMTYSCWGSVVVCAAFGLSRAAALNQDSGTAQV